MRATLVAMAARPVVQAAVAVDCSKVAAEAAAPEDFSQAVSATAAQEKAAAKRQAVGLRWPNTLILTTPSEALAIS